MLSEDKIKIMADISIYKKYHEKDIRIAQDFFTTDYVTRHMLKQFLGFTICYLLFIVVLVLYNSERLLAIFELQEAIDLAEKYIVIYFGGLAIFELLTILVFGIKYSYARRILRTYTGKLRRLAKKQEIG